MSANAGRRQRIIALLLIPAAVLVAVALLLLRLRMEPPTVPAYALVSIEDAGVVEVRPGETFSLEARPTAPEHGAIAARAFLVRGEQVLAWDPPFQVDGDGVVRIAGPVDSLFAKVPRGDWEVDVTIGRPETLPTAPKDVLRARHEQSGGTTAWRLVTERIRLE